MKSLKQKLLICAALLMFAVGCGDSDVGTQILPDEIAAPTSTQTAEPEQAASETVEVPLSGPAATVQALMDGITVVPSTPIGGGEAVSGPDDYVGIFNQAWNIVAANYVRDNFNGVDWDAVHEQYLPMAEDLESSEELWVLLEELIEELGDDHSRFVPPSAMQSNFGVGGNDGAAPLPWSGMSVWTEREDERMLIWCVSPGGPGDNAGLVRGDEILAIDGDTVERGEDGFTNDQIRTVLFGTGGSTVLLTIRQGPDNEPQDFEIPLGGANSCSGGIYAIISEEPYIGYIRVTSYGGGSDSNILQAINALEADQPLDALILDQRRNGGGNSDLDVRIFAQGIYGTLGPLREGSTRTILRARGPVSWNETTPMVVISDGNSASAAEYFAAAMQVLDRATLIGMPTAGNTEGINSYNLADGTLIRLAWTSFLYEDGTSLEGIGVIPDIEVPMGEWGLRQTPYDVQLQAAIDYLLDLLN